MKLDRKSFKKIIDSEMAYLMEACGCGGDHPRYMHDQEVSLGDPIMMNPDHQESPSGGMLSREEAIDLVSIIASRTSCPMTREVLMAAIDMIDQEMPGHEEHDSMPGMMSIIS